MRSTKLVSLVTSAMLAVPLAAVASSTAEASPNPPTFLERAEKIDAARGVETKTDVERYAKAEQASPDASKFSGGAAVLIVGPTLLIILAILLLLL